MNQNPELGGDFATDIAIVGAGPAGLFAVFQAGLLEMRCQVFDALAEVGGQCSALYPEKPIYDIPGYPEIAALELIDKLGVQIAPFDPVFHLGRTVEGLAEIEGGFELTAGDQNFTARAVIIAAGAGAFGPNRPPLEGIEDYENGGGVHYLVTRREDFRGKHVVIAGGGDSAVDWALSLAPLAASVALVHRRPKFRAAPESARRLEQLAQAGEIELVVPYQLAGLEGEGKLCGVRVATLDGEERLLEADVLLPFYGLATSLGPIAGWGLELAKGQITVDPASCQSSRPGIFAIGDVAAYPGKLKLILTGFAEAATAAHAIYPLVHPDQALHFEYSTTKGRPGG
ncbi:MAG TPA: NAD(P)/FAD-dependent oxidoreductase [Alphaproteobacteria bacterium]|jgi:thioredoxin reductase (NADPH)|nr:NAD(P)/FAD-dependent oxidoreductase [Alphaproteobacteria bacterium]MDP6271539.1 NAD(P)/FAD-dependent oxidoreductase [Alphaproteobacteria bacterium]MDP7164602.1 NAD(P)/FAD-dependent oxidoreductase [Alphaproteobacteria bacterium]MDP7428681.1 NAD(P)/FAD-dependent oxidoreductase [Alphaproteobacteria bacterium]HJM48380.1 NAD(P)/FAD-dependent oxidoreductase [Alphaproteobacteria bacterium]